MVHQLVQLLDPWKSLYGDSTLLVIIVTVLHLGGMFVGGGLALSADRATLLAWRGSEDERARQIALLGGVHKYAVTSIAVLFVSGIAMMAADLESFLASPALWIKLGLVAVLLVNGWLMLRQERRLRTPDGGGASTWASLRVHAIASIALWIATMIAGVVLANVS